MGIACVILANTRHAQRVGHTACPISTPAERGTPSIGKGAIVDITERRHPLDKRFYRRRALAFPAPLTQLSQQIGTQFRARRGISPGIVEREPLQRIRVQRCWGSARLMGHRHVYATVEPDFERVHCANIAGS